MKIFRFLVYILLGGISCLGIYLFKINTELIQEYKSRETKWVTGQLENYDLEETKKKIYFHIKLSGSEDYYSLPSPEWQSFDYENFKDIIDIGSELQLEIPQRSLSDERSINIYQIRHDKIDLIDFKEKLNKRITEKWLSLLFVVFGIAGIFHHHKKSWI